MNWKSIRTKIGEFLLPELFTERWNYLNERNKCYNDLYTTKKDVQTIRANYDKLSEKFIKITENKYNSLEKFCSDKYVEIPNKAYESKRKWQRNPISTFINQFITPNHFEVMKLRKDIPRGNTLTQDAFNIGNRVAKEFLWTDDSNLDTSGDYYLYPEEIIVDKKGDCEDHAFTVSSLNTEIGVAYGFLNKPTERIAHAFNMYIEKGKVYILETTGNSGVIHEYKVNDKYEIYFIVTQNKTYRVKSGTRFGKIAGW